MTHPLPTTSSPASPTLQAGDHVFLVDGNSFVFRAYFQSMNQDKKYNYRSDGLPTGAVRLFCTKLLQFVREGAVGIKPTHLAIIFDPPDGSFRKDIYPQYKAHRPPPPDDLIPQFPLMREAVKAFGLIPLEQAGFEADDLIATYARQAREAGADVLIISADKDLMQLLGDKVTMYDPASGTGGKNFRAERRIGVEEVKAYFGVPPSQVVDVQALAGDSSDNVPGVPGIGLKTAAQLMQDFDTLDNLLANTDKISQPKRREALIQNAELARISQRLVRLETHVDVAVPLSDLTLIDPDPQPLIAFLKGLEFTTLSKRIADAYEVDISAIEPATIAYAGAAPATFSNAVQTSEDAQAQSMNKGDVNATLPQRLAQKYLSEARQAVFDREAYVTIRDLKTLDAFIQEAREAGVMAIDTETTSLDAMQAELVGISLATRANRAAYIPLLHRGGTDLFGSGLTPDQLSTQDVITHLKPLLCDPAVLKIGQNIKYDLLVLSRYGVEITPLDDTMLMSYVLDAGVNGHGMDELSLKYFGHAPIPFSEVCGTGKNALTFDQIAIDKATAYAAEDADVTLRLHNVLKQRLIAEGRLSVYETLERPLPQVIAHMERRGITVDRAQLSRLSGEFAQTLERLAEEIHALAGEKFLIASPKQLGDVLFGKLGLPGAKKTASGQWATGASVLEELAEQGYELPQKILNWRQLAKLTSTYTDALPAYINRETGRVHTSFSLAATTTGRLSSSEPNLQNIPVRTLEGRKIRQAFVASQGHALISADYSQIELRLLAHMADITSLKQAFHDGLDIHAMTASEMFGVPIQGMDPLIRRRAKAINFGIIYGISAFGLANQLSISREEAGAYIRSYFDKFPGIKAYMDDMKAQCREKGFVKTIFGRVCHYPAITSKNASERAFVERQAINAPIQGSASDMIRRAMIRMDDALITQNLSAKMLLQVHDELIFEAPLDEVERTIPVIKAVMRDAPFPALNLSVPIEVDARAANNWDEAH
jgi:DNA polymerase-1